MNAAIKFGAPLLMALGLVSAPAMARDGWHGGSHGRGGHGAPAHDNGRHGGPAPGWHDNGRGQAYRPAPPPAYRGNVGYRYRAPAYRSGYRYAPPPRYVVHRGYYPGPRPIWVRGARYYGGGYGPTYVVNDWGGYGLAPPPYGYYWRRDDLGNFLLVAAATGIITDLILHH